jgi:hypothetical protein
VLDLVQPLAAIRQWWRLCLEITIPPGRNRIPNRLSHDDDIGTRLFAFFDNVDKLDLSNQLDPAMPAVRPPDVASAIEPPRCPDCGKTMRLESSEPNIHYANLDQLKFVCDCGQTTEKMVAH